MDTQVCYTEEDHKAVAVEGAVFAKALTRCHGLAGSDQQDGGGGVPYHLKIETLQFR